MKLHKLLYFAQRECLIQTDTPMFEAQFEAWKYGPVMVEIRQCYRTDTLTYSLTDEMLAMYGDILDTVFRTYAPQDSWSLSTLTHGEYCWNKAREGYDEYEACEMKILTDDIRKDACRVRQRRRVLERLNLHQPS